MTNVDHLLSKPFDERLVVQRSNRLFNRDSTFDTLPHESPFLENVGLRYASPPVDWSIVEGRGAGVYSPTTSFTFALTQTGSNIATLFPQAALIASQQMVTPVALVAVSLSYAIRNVTNTSAIALAVLISSNPVINLTGSANALVTAITPPGAAEQTWSDVRSNSFSLDVAPLVNANESVSLYCSCANQATDVVWASVTFKYVTL